MNTWSCWSPIISGLLRLSSCLLMEDMRDSTSVSAPPLPTLHQPVSLRAVVSMVSSVVLLYLVLPVSFRGERDAVPETHDTAVYDQRALVSSSFLASLWKSFPRNTYCVPGTTPKFIAISPLAFSLILTPLYGKDSIFLLHSQGLWHR